MRNTSHNDREEPRVRRAEAGVTLVELLLSTFVLTVGLLGLAQLFVVATMNNSLSVTTSEGLIDAQRCLEAYRSIAMTSPQGINDTRLVSGTYDAGTGNSPAYAAATVSTEYPSGYDSPKYKENVWVYSDTGPVTGGYAVVPDDPPGVENPMTTLRAPSATSRLVVVYLEPITNDPRYNQPVMLTTLISERWKTGP
jgi:hypothetical protein